MLPFKEPNAHAPSHVSNGGGDLERLDYHEEEGEEDGFGNDTAITDSLLGNNGKQNNGSTQHHSAQHDIMNEDEKDCIDKVLNRVAESMPGMKPVPSRYKPVSVRLHHNFPQCPNNADNVERSHSNPPLVTLAERRCTSDPPIVNLADTELNLQQSFPTTATATTIRRRPASQRRKSDFGLRAHVNNLKPPSSLDPDRASFELKQNAIYSMQTDGTLEQHSILENLRVEEQWNNQQNIWRRLAMQASSPDTSQKELIQRSTFLIMSIMTVGCGILWGLMYVALGEWLAACMPFIYSTCMSLTLFTCICNSSKQSRYDTFVDFQLALILLLPFAVHVALGGVVKSGGVMLWSFLCPVGAAFFRSAKESLRWYWLYLSISGALLMKEFWDVSDPVMMDEYNLESEADVLNGSSASSASLSSDTIQKLYFLMNVLGLKSIIFSAVFLFARELEKEYTKSEDVLLNILPSSIVKRVKRGEFPIVDHVASVTILFADLVGFTKASTELHPNFLIGLFLRDIFQAFDELVDAHGLEKIKTIGDAYMAVGGLNHGEKLSEQSQAQSAEYKGQKPHATNTMLLAVDMLKALKKVNKKYNLQFDLRIGVHTGPVVAGVLGLKRITYDVWGDSVNTASRMESNGVPDCIHLSDVMHSQISGMTNVFDFSCCGKINIKGKGEMTTFLAN
eukprot:CAMPEP_0172322956 /NCGR_PEP_ID=MMETSP1058-20130122/47423_1 /TAXON_ID=83371 /ORGANISM="Detonula confervacea, Strain CCMP 353" /LENGTH=677 /DNA_ID=CAMNT_0013038833 /DNA_START=51 /DNA_END=2081 /DNA_ORIENTATION=-